MSKGPVVVFAHGFLGVKSAPHRLFVKMVRKLLELGIASLRFDYFGSGDSEGIFYESTINSQKNDLIDVIKYVRDTSKYGVTKLGIVGYSLGGCVSSLMLSIHPHTLSLLWSYGPLWLTLCGV